MTVNGLRVPQSFTDALASGTLENCWQLKENVDAYGGHLETEIGNIFSNEASLVRETIRAAEGFEPNEEYGVSDEPVDAPGAIPDIVDFSKLVCFATAGDDAPFCFDFRDNENEPCVIWWDDWYWRRIAPDFRSFLALFDCSGDGQV